MISETVVYCIVVMLAYDCISCMHLQDISSVRLTGLGRFQIILLPSFRQTHPAGAVHLKIIINNFRHKRNLCLRRINPFMIGRRYFSSTQTLLHRIRHREKNLNRQPILLVSSN